MSETVQNRIARLLSNSGRTLSAAESCTGGQISHLLTTVSGSSTWYLGSVTSYATAIKEKVLGVPSRTVEQFGLTSGEVAAAMAEGVRALTGSTYAVATTGLAEGGDGHYPEGTVWIGVTGPAGTKARIYQCDLGRKGNIRRFANVALQTLAAYIENDLKKVDTVIRDFYGLEKAVTDAKKAYVAALVGGNHFYCHTVERDDEIIRKIITMERLFWEKNVIGGVEPIPDGSDATTEYFNSRFRNSNGQVIELPQEAISVCDEYQRIGEQLKTLETARNAAANTLKSYLREAEIGTVGDRKIMWKQISKSTVDTKRLKKLLVF